MASETLTIFWSWQSDSPSNISRSFVHDCLERAAKKLGEVTPFVIEVDRDTKGVGGMPGISETILSKIRVADIFVWDATLCYSVPRPAPNPNVMFELGYAIAVMGEGRLIGVMNTGAGAGPEDLPFDLRHKRWPLQYSLPPSQIGGQVTTGPSKAEVRDALVKSLAVAIEAAAKEPRRGALGSDVNLMSAKSLWGLIDSAWLQDWHSSRSNNPVVEAKETISRLQAYRRAAERPENHFTDPQLATRHDEFVAAVQKYVGTAAVEMAPASNSDYYMITSKMKDYFDGYDEQYGRQVDALMSACTKVWSCWSSYIHQLRAVFPEVVQDVRS